MKLPDNVTEDQFYDFAAVMGSAVAAREALVAAMRPSAQEAYRIVARFNALFMPERVPHRIRRRRPKFGVQVQ